MAISPSAGAQQLFESVFKRKAESPEETSFLRSAEGRKSGAALQGALEFRQQQGGFGQQQGGFTEEQLPQAEKGLALLQKKAKQADDAMKKVFGENLKLELKQIMLSSSAFKELQGQEQKLAGEVQERETLPDVKPGITDPVQAGAVSLRQRGELARLLTSTGQSIRLQESGVGSILDRLQATQQQQAESAQAGFNRQLQIVQQARAEAGEKRAAELFPLQKQRMIQELTGDTPFTNQEKLALLTNKDFEFTGNINDLEDLLNGRTTDDASPLVENQTKVGYTFGVPTSYNAAHSGVDKWAPAGSNVRAPRPMTITNIASGKELGITVFATDAQGNEWRFGHLSSNAGVKVGQQLNPGDILGLVGQTGTLSGGIDHLHYDVKQDGKFVDPRGLTTKVSDLFKPRTEDKLLSMSDAIKAGVPFGTTELQAMGIMPKSDKERERERAFGEVGKIIDLYDDLVPSVNTEDSRAKQINRYAVEALNRTNDNIVSMEALSATLASVIKLFGDSGRLSDQDFDRALKAVPNWQDPKSAAEIKIKQMRDILRSATNTPGGTNSIDTSKAETQQVGDIIDVGGGRQGTILEILE